MGMTHVTVLVRNPAQPDSTWEGLFLVDTGSVDSLVPAKHLRDIGLAPKSRRTYELADGTEVKMDIKHHRIPAPSLSFNEPNLPFLIGEIVNLPQAVGHSKSVAD